MQPQVVEFTDLLIRLAVAAGLGYVIGLERHVSHMPAGERTHAIVSLGAALFAILAITTFPDQQVAAGCVTGIGFLGAGLIMKSGFQIHGLTTAAGIWAVAGIGLAAGSGRLAIATATTVIVLLILVSERFIKLDDKLGKFVPEKESEDGKD